VTIANASIKVVGRAGVAEVKGMAGHWLVQRQSGLSQTVGHVKLFTSY